MTKVSIIIPIYNVEKYLRQCLDSVVNQTLKDIQIICINDGSTDKSLEIIKEYAKNDPRIFIIDKPNSGYGDSMNKGIEAAEGKYIGIVESDDFVELNMFEKLYNTAEENNLDLVRCQYYQYSSIKNTNVPTSVDYVVKNEIYKPIENQKVFYQPPAIWSNLAARELLNKNNIRFLKTPGASYQDTSFAFKLYACANRFMMIDDYFLHYRIDNDNSSVNSKSKAFYVCGEYKEIENFASGLNDYEKLRYIIPYIKYYCYRWNHERLVGNLKRQFLLRMSYEFLKDFLAGNIDKKYFDKKAYKRVKIIAFFPWLYLFRRYL